MKITMEVQPGKTKILLEGTTSSLSQEEGKKLRKQIFDAISGFLGLPGAGKPQEQQNAQQKDSSAAPARQQNGSTASEQRQNQTPPPAQPGQLKLAFGKYKGKTIQEVSAEPDGLNYLTWYRDTLVARNQKANLAEKYRQQNQAMINAINAILASQQQTYNQPPAPPEDLPGLPPEDTQGAEAANMSGADAGDVDPDLAAIASQFGGSVIPGDNSQDPLAPQRKKVRQLASQLGDPNLVKVDQLCLTYFKKKFEEITNPKEMSQLIEALENAVAQLKK